ncbi:MAG TPA: hypothetical protein VHM30_02260 [Gemmatimonadaceae bacterium]|nr:hypothetical protein [Gemmatimonadaceae bacterium]
MELALRALMPEDADAARAFVSAQLANDRYRVRALEVLDGALKFEDPEYMALLAFDDGGRRLCGLVLFGTVAGARSVVKVHGVIAVHLPAAVALLEAVARTSEHSGERMIVCEIPDDPALVVAAAALDATGFSEEGRVPDFIADGIALRLLVRPLYGA